MTSLVSKTMAFGMLAPFAALDGMSNSNHSSYIPGEPKHYNPKKHKIGIIICGILLILCPIVGIITFLEADWYMFFSIFVFGFIEILVMMIGLDDEVNCCLENSPGGYINYNHVYKYIYQDEFDFVSKKYCENLNIFIRMMLITAILNVYPFLFLFLGVWDILDAFIITQLLALFVLILNILFIVAAVKNRKYKDVWEIRQRPKTEKKQC